MSDLKNLASEFKIPCPSKINPDETILLVEDQQDVRLIVAHHLIKMGYRKVKQAGNGVEAIEILKELPGKVSAMICSMDMPELNGIDFLNEIQENPRFERGPFAISMTAPSKEKIMLATENGVDEIMVKPFALKDVFPKIQKAFRVYHNPANPEKVYELAKRCLREQKFDEADKIYQRIAESTKISARPMVGLARVAITKGEFEKALEYLKQAERRNKHFVYLYEVRGRVYIAQGRMDEALLEFKKAIEMSPLNPVRYEAAADILFEQRKYEDAITLLGIAVKNELSFPSLHHYLSQAHYAVGDFKKAIKHIRSALVIAPENVVYLNQLGIAYKESKLYEDATKVYNSIIKLDPDNRAALYNKAILLNTTGATGEAVRLLRRLLERFPDFTPAISKLQEYTNETPKAAG